MTLAELLTEQLEWTRDWTLKLIADLKGDDWGFQPAAGLAHPLYLCGHFAVSQDALIHARCLGKGILPGSFKEHFPIGAPIKSLAQHKYPSIDEILKTMSDTHERTCAVVKTMTDVLLAEPAYAADGKSMHPHYKDKRGAVSHCVRHEAFHAGQIATIRRLLGKPFLR